MRGVIGQQPRVVYLSLHLRDLSSRDLKIGDLLSKCTPLVRILDRFFKSHLRYPDADRRNCDPPPEEHLLCVLESLTVRADQVVARNFHVVKVQSHEARAFETELGYVHSV